MSYYKPLLGFSPSLQLWYTWARRWTD